MSIRRFTRRWWQSVNGTWEEQCRTRRKLAEARRPQEIQAVRLQDGRVTGNKREVLEEVARSFQKQHNQGQQRLSRTTQLMVQALQRVFTAEQSEAICRRGVMLGETKAAVDKLVAEAYQNLEAPELDGLADRDTELLRTGKPPAQ